MKIIKLIFIFAIGVAVGLYLSTVVGTQEVGENLVTYVNKELGFSFQYPEQWGELEIKFSEKKPVTLDEYSHNNGDIIYRKKFVIKFINNNTVVAGGISCLECEPPIWQMGYSLVYEDGKFENKTGLQHGGFLSAGKAKNCEITCFHESQKMAAFPLSSEYRYISFLGEDNQNFDFVVNSFDIKK
ncbi:MAG: hypothetical protein ACI9AR_000017 [Flavobacteriaceae bacterium]|jgi:hypothetical protein